MNNIIKIIKLFRNNLDKGMTILEISKKLKIGYRPAYNHIIEMAKAEILDVHKVGNAKQCFLNLQSEQSIQWLSHLALQQKNEICRRNIKLSNILKNLVHTLVEQNISDVHSIILFGSHVKGKPVKESDVDIFFIITSLDNKKLKSNIENLCSTFQYSHNLKINPIISDVEELLKMLKSKSLTVGKEIRKYGLALYGSTKFWEIMNQN